MTTTLRNTTCALALVAALAVASPVWADDAAKAPPEPPCGKMMHHPMGEEGKAMREHMEALHKALAEDRAGLEKGDSDKAFLAKVAKDLGELDQAHKEMREKMKERMKEHMKGMGKEGGKMDMGAPAGAGGEPPPPPAGE